MTHYYNCVSITLLRHHHYQVLITKYQVNNYIDVLLRVVLLQGYNIIVINYYMSIITYYYKFFITYYYIILASCL